ncbi:hypothetical protein D9619_000048 [Psilocybe cf. subviscida]|uniref:Uncharacterized protein n=1 Tax=Psilocybe cf. subviscida TaxID=2480587 RepID=A0A8H5BGV2_9AGAR|nr:hypothetical protein D9619_000048 [Psilocybe cf. subviscida]
MPQKCFNVELYFLVTPQAALPSHNYQCWSLIVSLNPPKHAMQFKTLFVAATLAFASTASALTCNTHNNQVLCSTTHHCVNGHVTHIPGTFAGNGHCMQACHCPSGYPSPPPTPPGHHHRRAVEYIDFDDLI